MIRFWEAGEASADIRERVIAEVESGASRREGAEEVEISASDYLG